MHRTPENEEERQAWAAMAECILETMKLNTHLAQRDSPTRDVPEFERRMWVAIGDLIANAPLEQRGYLAWTAWASFQTDLQPGQRNAA